jgi:hypothetical protein
MIGARAAAARSTRSAAARGTELGVLGRPLAGMKRQRQVRSGLGGEADGKTHARKRCFPPFRSATNPPLDGLKFCGVNAPSGFEARPRQSLSAIRFPTRSSRTTVSTSKDWRDVDTRRPGKLVYCSRRSDTASFPRPALVGSPDPLLRLTPDRFCPRQVLLLSVRTQPERRDSASVPSSRLHAPLATGQRFRIRRTARYPARRR